ncbi:chromatin assembly factor 1 subunit A [Rhinophrynus dorsalis]
MPGKEDLGNETSERRVTSSTVMKSSSSVTSKRTVQARLPFKRLNPVPVEKEKPHEDKSDLSQKESVPKISNTICTPVEHLQNDCQIEVTGESPLQKSVHGRGPLDNYLKKAPKRSSGPHIITIDLTEDSDTASSCAAERHQTTNGLVSMESGPLSPPPFTESQKCNSKMTKTPEQVSDSAQDMVSLELDHATAVSKQSPLKVTNEDGDRATEEDSINLSSTSSPDSVSSPDSQHKDGLSRLEAKTPILKGKREKRQKLQAAKEERERAREAARAAKERAKEEAKKKREDEKEQREKEKREKKEKDDREKAEKLRLKEEKKKEKLEAFEAKQEEKRKKEEEKKLKDEEKLMKAEKSEITRFFQKPKTPPAPKTFANTCGKFAPFEIKKNMAVAPLCRVEFHLQASEQLDRLLTEQSSKEFFLEEIKNRKSRKMGRTVVPKLPVLNSDGMNGELDEIQLLEDSDIVLDKKIMLEDHLNKSNVPARQKFGRMKLLQFCENYRPAYWGTWNRQSRLILPRKPWAQDTELLDYEVESDEEWEEEEPGESLSHSEGDDDNELKEEEEDDDGFFVPHGYLSEDEGGVSDEDFTDPENQKLRQRLKAKEWDELQSKCKKIHVLQPVVVGCVWQCSSSAIDISLLQKFSVTVLDMPVTEEEVTQEFGTTRNLTDKQILSNLLPLLHGNVNGSKIIIQEFQECCRQGHFSETGGIGTAKNLSVSPDSRTQTLNDIVPSKAHLKRIISENSVYEKRPEYRMCWYVHSDVLKSLEQETLPVPCQWNYITQVNSLTRDDSGTAGGPSPTEPVSSKRKSAGSMPITKFMKRARNIVEVGTRETDGFQADTEEEDDDCMILEDQQSQDECKMDITLTDAAVPTSSQP